MVTARGHRRGLRRTALAGLLLASSAAPALAGRDDVPFLTLAAGAFDIGKDETAAEGRLEYRSDYKLWIFKPFGGVMGTSDKAFFGYAGVLVDLYWGRRVVTTLSFAPGYYSHGDGKHLGYDLEFRSQFEIAYRFDDRSRLGLSYGHMSNASLGDKNPGTESLMLNYSLPLGRLLGE